MKLFQVGINLDGADSTVLVVADDAKQAVCQAEQVEPRGQILSASVLAEDCTVGSSADQMALRLARTSLVECIARMMCSQEMMCGSLASFCSVRAMMGGSFKPDDFSFLWKALVDYVMKPLEDNRPLHDEIIQRQVEIKKAREQVESAHGGRRGSA